MGAGEYKGTLKIYGPIGTKKRIEMALEAFLFENNLEYKVVEIKEGKIVDNDNFYIEAYKLEHGIETYGFRVNEKDKRKIRVGYVQKLGIPEGPLLGKLQDGKDIEFKGKKVKVEDATILVKGRVLGIICDTVFCSNCLKIAKNADVLVSEAAYDSQLEEKATEYKHMTARQAAQIASQQDVKKLVLFHYSQRYKTTEKILDDAKAVFQNTIAADDFTRIKM